MTSNNPNLPAIFAHISEALASERPHAALQALRHADAGGQLKSDETLLKDLNEAVGEKATASLVELLAADRCPYCKAGREKCEDCGGKGYYAGVKVCKPCAGLGLRRCPFCSGTSLAGYDFVPRGLRRPVMAQRLQTARQQIALLSSKKQLQVAGVQHIAKQILSIDRCRGILANAVDQVRQNELSAAAVRQRYTASERVKIEKACKESNTKAEQAIQSLLKSLAAAFAHKIERSDQDPEHRTLLAHRAKVFSSLGEEEGLAGCVLRTPLALRPGR